MAPLRPRETAVSSFRITLDQQEALVREAKIYTISGSAIVRALLKLYFEDKIPEALTIALTEAQKAEAAIKEGPLKQQAEIRAQKQQDKTETAA